MDRCKVFGVSVVEDGSKEHYILNVQYVPGTVTCYMMM